MISIKKATTTDTNDIHIMLENIVNSMGEDIIEGINIDYLRDIIAHLGFAVIAYDNDADNKIVGVTVVLYPSAGDKNNIGRDIGLKLPWQLNKVTDILITAVSSEYRGQGIHKRLIQYTENVTDRSKYILSSVLSKNSAGISAFEALGYEVVNSKVDAVGRNKTILCKKK